MRRSAVVLLVLGLALGFSPQARAIGPLDVEMGARVGAGSNPMGGGFPSPLGVGMGGRAGVSVFGLYAGISAMYYFGASGQLGFVDALTYEHGSVSPHSFLYGVELGYGLKFARLVVLRAQLGLGDDVLGMSGGVAMGARNNNVLAPAEPVRATDYLYLEPGVTALVEVGKVYAGVDVTALLLPSGPQWPPNGALSRASSPFSSSHTLDAAVTVHAQVGVRF